MYIANSFGLYFICKVEGELLIEGDDTADIHWASTEELQKIIDEHKFSEIDLPAALMFLRYTKEFPNSSVHIIDFLTN